jgi:hypothetical protein
MASASACAAEIIGARNHLIKHGSNTLPGGIHSFESLNHSHHPSSAFYFASSFPLPKAAAIASANFCR